MHLRLIPSHCGSTPGNPTACRLTTLPSHRRIPNVIKVPSLLQRPIQKIQLILPVHQAEKSTRSCQALQQHGATQAPPSESRGSWFQTFLTRRGRIAADSGPQKAHRKWTRWRADYDDAPVRCGRRQSEFSLPKACSLCCLHYHASLSRLLIFAVMPTANDLSAGSGGAAALVTRYRRAGVLAQRHSIKN